MILNGQQPPPFRAAVDVVQLDVSVLDAERRPIAGLTAADFTVIDKGAPQPIVAFEEINVPGPAATAAAWVKDAPIDVSTNDTKTRRVVVIVVDDAFMPVESGKMAMEIGRAVIDQMGPADLGAVTFTEHGPRQDITSDRTLLRKAIDGLVPHPGGLQLGPGTRMQARSGRGGAIAPSTPGGCGSRGPYRTPAACVIDTFVTAADALLRAPIGKKTLIYISGGAPVDFTMSDLRGGETAPVGEQVMAIQKMLKALQDANVNVYAIDPSGLTADGIAAPRLDSLRMISEDTGGRATIATNTPAEAVPQIFRENSSYYLIGVRSAAGAPAGEFHRLQITVNRPGAEVRARPGYTAGARIVPSTENSAAAAALAGALPGGSLPLAVATAAVAIPGEKQAALAVVTAFRDPPTTRQTFEVVTMALDADCGDCRKLPTQRQTVALSAPPAQTPDQSGLRTAELLSRLELSPGKYEIRVAASSEGVSGSVITHVEVPEFTKEHLSASGLVFSTRGAAPASGLMADVLPLTPTARREFRADSTVKAFLRIYQGSNKPSGVQVTATIRDTADKVVLDRTTPIDPTTFAKTKSADFVLDLPLATLKPGEHLLSIDVHAGALVVQRSARFSMR